MFGEKYKLAALLIGVCLFFTGCSSNKQESIPAEDNKVVNIAVAWNNVRSYSFESTVAAANELDATITELPMLRSYDMEYDDDGMLIGAKDEHGILTTEAAKLVKTNTWQNSDVELVMQDIDAVIFPGGSDICPTLYYSEQAWHGIESDTDYSAERDVSDYILMSYCLEKDIPILAICRGMQMLSVVSGADIIQDIGQWYNAQGVAYDHTHRDPEKKVFCSHSIDIVSDDSLIYSITGQRELTDCPSWHHQAVGDISGTRLTVTARTVSNGIEIIEAVERKDKTFCLGVQFHPEVAVRKVLDKADDAADFMEYDAAMSFFRALESQCR